MGTAAIRTTIGPGIWRIHLVFTFGKPNKIRSDKMPIKHTSGFRFRMLCGISASRWSGSFPFGTTPRATCVCFEMMMTPIAANIP